MFTRRSGSMFPSVTMSLYYSGFMLLPAMLRVRDSSRKDFDYGKPPQNGYAIDNYSLHLRQPSVIHEYHLSDRYGRSGSFQWSVPGGIMRSSVMAALPRPLPGGEREGVSGGWIRTSCRHDDQFLTHMNR